jgi:PAN domain
MRFQTVFTAAVIGACSIAAIGAPAMAAGQRDAYQILSVSSAEACARACEDDGLCIAWTFTDTGACNLSAVAPQHTPGDMKYGVSSRAPSFARALAEMRGPTEPPAIAEAAPTPGPAPNTSELRSSEEVAFEEASLALLGGPEDETPRVSQ